VRRRSWRIRPPEGRSPAFARRLTVAVPIIVTRRCRRTGLKVPRCWPPDDRCPCGQTPRGRRCRSSDSPVLTSPLLFTRRCRQMRFPGHFRFPPVAVPILTDGPACRRGYQCLAPSLAGRRPVTDSLAFVRAFLSKRPLRPLLHLGVSLAGSEPVGRSSAFSGLLCRWPGYQRPSPWQRSCDCTSRQRVRRSSVFLSEDHPVNGTVRY